MDYSMIIWAICIAIESRAGSRIDWQEIVQETGYSLSHMREIFRTQTGQTLSHYAMERKLANAAQQLLQTTEDIQTIALRYGFSSRDVFTRTLRRYTGFTPSQLRRIRPLPAQVKLCAGVFGPALPRTDQEETSH